MHIRLIVTYIRTYHVIWTCIAVLMHICTLARDLYMPPSIPAVCDATIASCLSQASLKRYSSGFQVGDCLFVSWYGMPFCCDVPLSFAISSECSKALVLLLLFYMCSWCECVLMSAVLPVCLVFVLLCQYNYYTFPLSLSLSMVVVRCRLRAGESSWEARWSAMISPLRKQVLFISLLAYRASFWMRGR